MVAHHTDLLNLFPMKTLSEKRTVQKLNPFLIYQLPVQQWHRIKGGNDGSPPENGVIGVEDVVGT